MNKTRIISLILAALMLAVMLTGCSKKAPSSVAVNTALPTEQAQQETADPGIPTNVPTLKITAVNEAGQATPITIYSSAALAGQIFEYDTRYTACNNAFAVKMAEAIATKNENWTGVFSPLSLQMVLQMLANGGDEDTSAALLEAVCQGMTRDDVNKSAAKLMSIFNTIRSVSMNSAVIVNDNYRVRQDYADAMGTYYKAGVGTVDLNAPDAAEEQINAWISERTGGLINDLIDDLSYDTVMVLLNVLMFDMEWDEPFVAFRELSEFNGANGVEMVGMMRCSNEMLYGSFDEGQMAVIPYRNPDYAMAVILPEKDITPVQAIAALLSRAGECEMKNGTVTMPKINLDTKLDLMELVAAMGLEDAINGEYTGLLADDTDASVSRIIQGAVMDVNERGTTAAAATAVELNKSAPPVADTFTITCDRPYAMVIYNVQTGAVMFVSTVNSVG